MFPVKNLVKYYREEIGISQRELARLAEVSHTEIIKIENEGREPKLSKARQISKALCKSIGEVWPEEKINNER